MVLAKIKLKTWLSEQPFCLLENYSKQDVSKILKRASVLLSRNIERQVLTFNAEEKKNTIEHQLANPVDKDAWAEAEKLVRKQYVAIKGYAGVDSDTAKSARKLAALAVKHKKALSAVLAIFYEFEKLKGSNALDYKKDFTIDSEVARYFEFAYEVIIKSTSLRDVTSDARQVESVIEKYIMLAESVGLSNLLKGAIHAVVSAKFEELENAKTPTIKKYAEWIHNVDRAAEVDFKDIFVALEVAIENYKTNKTTGYEAYLDDFKNRVPAPPTEKPKDEQQAIKDPVFQEVAELVQEYEAAYKPEDRTPETLFDFLSETGFHSWQISDALSQVGRPADISHASKYSDPSNTGTNTKMVLNKIKQHLTTMSEDERKYLLKLIEEDFY